jgi:hypothetical protein
VKWRGSEVGLGGGRVSIDSPPSTPRPPTAQARPGSLSVLGFEGVHAHSSTHSVNTGDLNLLGPIKRIRWHEAALPSANSGICKVL